MHPVHLVHPMIFGAINSRCSIKVHTSRSSALLCIQCIHCTLCTLQPCLFENAPECTLYRSVHFVRLVQPVHPRYFRVINFFWCFKLQSAHDHDSKLCTFVHLLHPVLPVHLIAIYIRKCTRVHTLLICALSSCAPRAPSAPFVLQRYYF